MSQYVTIWFIKNFAIFFIYFFCYFLFTDNHSIFMQQTATLTCKLYSRKSLPSTEATNVFNLTQRQILQQQKLSLDHLKSLVGWKNILNYTQDFLLVVCLSVLCPYIWRLCYYPPFCDCTVPYCTSLEAWNWVAAGQHINVVTPGHQFGQIQRFLYFQVIILEKLLTVLSPQP